MTRAKKRNYRAERKAAADFADAAMEGRALPQREWLQMWGVIYEARLAQIRGTVFPGTLVMGNAL